MLTLKCSTLEFYVLYVVDLHSSMRKFCYILRQNKTLLVNQEAVSATMTCLALTGSVYEAISSAVSDYESGEQISFFVVKFKCLCRYWILMIKFPF